MKTKIIFLLLITVLQAQAEVRFVSKTGNSVPPYTSWATAADSIQKAIDYCDTGDTVVVANGVYKESLWIKKVITLLGTSMDSTIIDSRGIFGKKEKWTKILLEDTATIKNFTIYGTDYAIFPDTTIIIRSFYKSTKIENCRMQYGLSAISGYCNDYLLNNLIFENLSGSYIGAKYYDEKGLTITNKCLFVQPNSYYYTGNGGSHIYTNNIYYPKDVTYQKQGVIIYFANKITYSNNLSIGLLLGLDAGGFCDTLEINNNVFANSKSVNIRANTTKKLEIKNNIFSNAETGIIMWPNPNGIIDYNIFYNNKVNINNDSLLGIHNLFLDPMFVADSSSINGRGDYHLQKYSPAIDAGDPNMKDADGTRSDIGMYGGFDGQNYIYNDLAPRTPVNLQLEVVNKQLKLKWNKNSESDFAFYRIYKDTVKNFKADSLKKVSEISDTLFFDSVPMRNNVYFKITAVDKNKNESKFSEEAGYLITEVEKGKVLINDNDLYQNYPNPFNPKTKMGYKLKEKGKVRLSIYDIQGKLVETILNNVERSAGYHEDEFPKQKNNMLASGIYICRIEILNSGGIPVFNDSIKMLYLK